MTRFRIVAGLAGITTLAASLLPGVAAAEVPTGMVPAGLEAAIEQHIEAQGMDYAGLCRVVNERPTIPVGQACAFVQSIEHDIAEVTYGPVLTDEIHRVSFYNQGGAWTLMGGQPLPPTDGAGNGGDSQAPAAPAPDTTDAPALETGDDDGDGLGTTTLATAAVALAAGLVVTGGLALRRR